MRNRCSFADCGETEESFHEIRFRMKVKILSRNPENYQRETKNDIFKGNSLHFAIAIIFSALFMV